MRKYIIIPILLYLVYYFSWSKYKLFLQKQSSTSAPTEFKHNDLIKAYIDSFHLIASHEMLRSGVPASIKLAQGILESQYGQSELAKNAHNHFGIKCGSPWKGNRYCKFSTEWNDNESASNQLGCFRGYENVIACYRAHSDFLRHRVFYKDLFYLCSYDYKSWAIGLQDAGYATDPKYAQKLISLIERFQLYRYDIPNLAPEFPLVKKRMRFSKNNIMAVSE